VRSSSGALRGAIEYYERANLLPRFAMEDAIYRLSMELLAKIIGPFDVMGSVPSNRNTSKIRWID